jgi:hypothetical protein
MNSFINSISSMSTEVLFNKIIELEAIRNETEKKYQELKDISQLIAGKMSQSSLITLHLACLKYGLPTPIVNEDGTVANSNALYAIIGSRISIEQSRLSIIAGMQDAVKKQLGAKDNRTVGE